MKSWVFFLSCLVLAGCDWLKPDHSKIYFISELYGSLGYNIFSVDLNKNLTRHTFNEASRDLVFALDKPGNIVFNTNRVIDRKLYNTPQSQNTKGRRQFYNAFYLPYGKTETDGLVSVAKPITFGTDHVIHVSMSADGHWVATVTQQFMPEGKYRYVLSVMDMQQRDKVQEIDSANSIPSSEWSADSQQLVYATYDTQAVAAGDASAEAAQTPPERTAKLKVWDNRSNKIQVLLENPWGEAKMSDAKTGDAKIPNAQMDNPQWSPDGQWISLVKQPFTEKEDRKLFVYHLKTQKFTQISSDKGHVQSPIAWSADSQNIVYSSLIDYQQDWSDELRTKVYFGSGQIFIANMQGDLKQITQGDKVLHFNPTFSPDGKKIAYVFLEDMGSDKGVLRVIDRQGNLIADLYDRAYRSGQLFWRK